jgi:hypothetical protein
MTSRPKSTTPLKTSAEWESQLLLEYGMFVGGRDLRRLLGYKCAATFRNAAIQGRLPVATISLPGRRGRLARVRDVAQWLAKMDQILDSKYQTEIEHDREEAVVK